MNNPNPGFLNFVVVPLLQIANYFKFEILTAYALVAGTLYLCIHTFEKVHPRRREIRAARRPGIWPSLYHPETLQEILAMNGWGRAMREGRGPKAHRV